ncbi:MAG: Holliday junction branch migration protein RuvA [Candidatus Omnitrophota bacterium]
MISHITGKIIDEKPNALFIETGALCYEVFVPVSVMQAVKALQDESGCVRLITYYYHQNDPSRSVPVLIGFSNYVEKEFFELFITVSGIGPKAAVRALALPIPSIVEAIDGSDFNLLQSLPGIGKQRAREIVAKLQGKVGKFGLMKKSDAEKSGFEINEDIHSEALSVLQQLQYNVKEAKEMIKKALSNNSKIKDTEELLNEIYKQRRQNDGR